MRDIDPEPIHNALENIRLGHHQKILVFKKIEKSRINFKPIVRKRNDKINNDIHKSGKTYKSLVLSEKASER